MNRPDVLNALNRETLECLIARGDEIRADAGVRAVVLTGAGRAFVAGADIAEMSRLSSQEAVAFSRLGHRAMDGIESLPVPVIAAVNGFALGGGCE
ncbi:MAG: crotonase, partial [Myxococcales bacterium]|nr:crotonase [Myxococcales bacterium]